MPLDFVNHQGQPVNIHGSGPSFQAKPKPKSEPATSFHRGFVVVGHPPKSLADAKKQAKAAGVRWDADEWMRKTALKRATRAFGSPQAAEDAAELCRKSGWLSVRVDALAKGEAPKQALF